MELKACQIAVSHTASLTRTNCRFATPAAVRTFGHYALVIPILQTVYHDVVAQAAPGR